MDWKAGGFAHLTGVHAGATRAPVMGTQGAVASNHWLASAEGLAVLRDGGNAFDAAVATAAVVAVVEPFMSGVGGCGGALCYDAEADTYLALDFNGVAASAATPAHWKTPEDMMTGYSGALVPGVVAGWGAVHERLGTLPWSRLLAPAIRLAEDGVPMSILTAERLRAAQQKLALDPWLAAAFVRKDRHPRPGDLYVQTALGRTLRELAELGPRAFYEGPIAEAIVHSCQTHDGLLTREDLGEYHPLWLKPLAVNYRGHPVHTLPPPFGSMQALETLRLLETFDIASLGFQSAEHLHLVIEAIKIAREDKNQHARSSDTDIGLLFSESAIAGRRTAIDHNTAALTRGERAQGARPVTASASHTTHLVAADAQGNLASLTQTLGHLFGAGVSVPEYGIALNDMAYWFDLDPASPNAIGPRKRQTSPITPVIFNDGARRRTALGTPGGFGIPQTTAQMLIGLIDFGLPSTTVAEAPRFRVDEGRTVSMEGRVPPAIISALRSRGHEVIELGPWLWDVQPGRGDLGRAAIVTHDAAAGTVDAASDPRGDGLALAW